MKIFNFKIIYNVYYTFVYKIIFNSFISQITSFNKTFSTKLNLFIFFRKIKMECDYEKYSCELLDKSAIDHDLSFKIVIIGNSGNKVKIIFNSS